MSPRIGKQMAAQRHELGTTSVCEYAEMSDAGEAARQVEQEAPKELIGAECHLPLFVAVGVVLPPDCDVVILKGQQPVIGGGDPVRVTCQVLRGPVESVRDLVPTFFCAADVLARFAVLQRKFLRRHCFVHVDGDASIAFCLEGRR